MTRSNSNFSNPKKIRFFDVITVGKLEVCVDKENLKCCAVFSDRSSFLAAVILVVFQSLDICFFLFSFGKFMYYFCDLN